MSFARRRRLWRSAAVKSGILWMDYPRHYLRVLRAVKYVQSGLWTCPYCRDVYLEGNDQEYPPEQQEGVTTQVLDAVIRTIWELDTRPDLYEDPENSHSIMIDSEEEDAGYDFDSVDEDTQEAVVSSFLS